MRDWELLDSAVIPGDGGEMRLYRHGNDFSIWANDGELMNSRVHGSEDELGTLICSRLMGAPTVLIVGLGMGFTLSAALRELEPNAKVDVAELVGAVITWNRGPLAHLAHHPLKDPRVNVLRKDVAQVLRTRHDTYDAVILDVDNGPEGFTTDANNEIYSEEGLEAVYSSLRSRGLLAVWSAKGDKSFVMRLRKADFDIEVIHPQAVKDQENHHTIWIAMKRD